ncbi:efflux transporter outer membrane subunit [Rhizorhapis suberifaciens]|uniref:NodT family efflux transporter outer membrane factor (OMF) lipoprotein n=1 Tax=Rhizorhapis suberifaciens TaxID=13656 RepID=A0A840HQL6_9SPHN|nr:efflux transporter outer membrane subunit [Rhizorhapis suberifaciens]MBB4639939.1 NodT family efflux transporter outer membrane factor (OMF) lipoprotein [Rhizorhapis suberifaciens]
MRNLRHLIAAASVSVSLSGCAVGPRYDAPSLSTPPAFMGEAAVEARAAPIATVDLVDWWRSFNDPMLTSFVDRALAQNLDLQQATARVTQARAALKNANAALLPSGQLSGQASELYQSKETSIGRLASSFPGFDRETQSYEANLGASWELDLFGGNDAARDAARADWQASQAAAVAARLAVIAQTADTYILIRALQMRLAIANEQSDTQRRLVELIALQYRKGVAAELQLRQAEGALSQVQAVVPELEQGLDAAMNALDVLVGVQPGASRGELTPARPIPAPPSVSTAGGPAEMLRRRPDVIAAERRLAASNARIGVAMAEYYPKLSLSGLLGSATTAIGGFLGSGATQAGGIMGLRWRLFDFGRIDAEIKVARGRNAEELAAYRLTVLRASEDVENAFSGLVKQEARAEILGQGETSLTRARSASLAAYKGGVSSLLDVLDADRRLLETRDAEVQAKAAAARAAVASFRALGGGWDPGSGAIAVK